MWFIFALIGAILWSFVSLCDKISVRLLFTRPSQGLFVSALFSGVGLLFSVVAGWKVPSQSLFLWAMLGALLLQASQFFYFRAMDSEEVGDLVVYGSTHPLLVALIVIPLGKTLTLLEWIGIGLILCGVAALEWRRAKRSLRSKLDVAGYVVCLASSSVVLNNALDHAPFAQVLVPYCSGLVIGGLFPMMIANERKELAKVWGNLCSRIWLLGAVEVINVVSLMCELYALSMGHPALVNAVASAEPAFVLMFAHLLGTIPGLRPYFAQAEKLRYKLMIAIVIAAGLALLAIPK